MESVGRGFSTISGSSTVSVASIDSIVLTISWFGGNGSTWSKSTSYFEMDPLSSSLGGLGSRKFSMDCGINEEVCAATIS